jgi:hypothetical protein
MLHYERLYFHNGVPGYPKIPDFGIPNTLIKSQGKKNRIIEAGRKLLADQRRVHREAKNLR